MSLEINHTNLVLSIRWYVSDNWYGKNYRAVFNGLLDEGFRTKKEANVFTSMLKKYVKNNFRDYRGGDVEISRYENLETYRYCGAGPSWSCSNILVNKEDFLKFIDKEKKRLEEGKSIRDNEKKIRVAGKMARSYHW